jgi:GNAT superfamily N-acetyltransferase
MLRIERSNSSNSDFKKLVVELDKELRILDGEDHSFYAQFNKVDSIKYVVLAYLNDKPVGCGAIKQYDDTTMEIKRMFVPLEFRGQGIATLVLNELEKWSKEMNFKKCILETGEKQTVAIRLYHKNDYKIIPNYGQYAGVEYSICFEKLL